MYPTLPVSTQHKGADAAYLAVISVYLGGSQSRVLFAESAAFIVLCYLAKSVLGSLSTHFPMPAMFDCTYLCFSDQITHP